MGFFKKIFRPVSKVLDKVVPNEIKPFLPYAAAFAPMLAPTTGFMGSMMGRALLAGGANLGAQLSQEGSEGDFNELSTLLAGGIGALSAPGTPNKAMGVDKFGNTIYQPGTQSAGEYLKGLSNSGGIGDKALNFLGTGADKLSALNQAGMDDPFSMAGIKAAGIPFAQGSGDVMYAEGREAQKDYERALEEYEASAGELANDEGRALAIRAAMEAGQHDENVIIETLKSLGLYAHGGRVRAMGGGLMNAKRGLVDAPGGYAGITEIENMREFRIANPNIEDVADYKGYYDRKNNPEKYDEDGFEIKEEIKEKFTAPDFGGITEAVGNIEEEKQLMASRAKDLFMLRDKAIMREDFDKIQEIELDFFKEFGIEMPVSQNESSGPIMAAEGGMMSVLPQGMEMDYRGGGFIPMGSKEKADDVPARVSKNEFVMTADAVRAAGGGSVNQGAKRMYNLMNNLEARA
tara:strand:- start:6403 stop:7788 length:1386 start_codon:yes stop_codon:yes gene_type:complete